MMGLAWRGGVVGRPRQFEEISKIFWETKQG